MPLWWISREMKRFIFALPFVLVASAAVGAEWTTWVVPDSIDAGAGITMQDDGSLFVLCKDHKYLGIAFHEPRALWQKGQSADVVLGLDDGPNLSPWRATATAPATLLIFDAAIQNIRIMGQAKTSFKVTAGGYTRVFPATNFHEAVQPVLQACGESWDHSSTGTAMKTFLLLVTWFTPGQPTTNYQVAFNAPEICEAARIKVINDAQRVRQEKIDQASRSPMGGQQMATLAEMSAPSVSAVCVAQ